MKTRDAKIDNVKGILIFFVVFGHLLELVITKGHAKYIYELIYSFHMPFFIFLSGYFYKFNFSRILQKLFCPYVVMQTVYLLFDRWILGNNTTLQYHKPYWILWYLLAMTAWSFMAVLFPKGKLKREILFLVITTVISLLAGNCNEIGRDYGLARIIVFFPFFLWGNYFHEWIRRSNENNRWISFKKGMKKAAILAGGFILVYAVALFYYYPHTKYSWFYEAVEYQESGSTIWFRLLHIVIAACFIIFLLYCIPNKKICILTNVGKSTLTIFLLHGFVVKLLGKSGILKNIQHPFVAISLLTIAIVLILSINGHNLIKQIAGKKGLCMEKRRVFLIVLDSYGIGEAPDAADFGDVGSNTLKSITSSKEYATPLMKKMGLFNIDGVDYLEDEKAPLGAYARLKEQSRGKDTTIGHWEIAGIISKKPLPTYPDGFPKDVLEEFSKKTGRGVLCNKPYSGTEVIKDFGQEHIKTGDLIVYTSADSVFQIAAHEDVVPVEELYRYCEIAREMLTGEHGVGRVIARPFTGSYPDFERTPRRHDFSLLPPQPTMMDALIENGYDTYGIGKIYDIFAGKGIQQTQRIVDNVDGMEKTIALMDTDFNGLCFVNLVDFDMKYGHRNDIDGYAKAATVFDEQLKTFVDKMRDTDILMITADHGCDPGFKGTDHSREYVPFLAYGKDIQENVNLNTRDSFADIAATIQDIFSVQQITSGTSFKAEIMK